ncbi:MAG: hypothetical protein WBQ73_00765 [Candidatus Babeliales bacterium]
MKLYTLTLFTALSLITIECRCSTNTQQDVLKPIGTVKNFPSDKSINRMKKFISSPLFSTCTPAHLLMSTIAGYHALYYLNNLILKTRGEVPLSLVFAYASSILYLSYKLQDILIRKPLMRNYEKLTFLSNCEKYYQYKKDNPESLPEGITCESSYDNDWKIIQMKRLLSGNDSDFATLHNLLKEIQEESSKQKNLSKERKRWFFNAEQLNRTYYKLLEQ